MPTPTIPQNQDLVKNFLNLFEAHRHIFGQERVYQRALTLASGEVFVFGRHWITQILMGLGQNEQDWSAWYRLFSQGRFDATAASRVMFEETLKHSDPEQVYVTVGDGTQVPRVSKTMEGSSWLVNPRTPPFKRGIHRAQRFFNGAYMLPPEAGYSRAVPLQFVPAFPEKAVHEQHEPCKEWEAAVMFMQWVRTGLDECGRSEQASLMVGDGSYDTIPLWQHLPERCILLARSAKNRVLHELLSGEHHGNRKYGARAETPQQFWRKRTGWRKTTLLLRGTQRQLQYRVEGPFVRKGVSDQPLFLLIIRGQKYLKYGRRKYREPVPYLVNAVQNEQGEWVLPLPVDTLIFWAWQRWEIEVCHRELKSNLGLGHKQCWNPTSAVLTVQWSAWVYSLLLLSAYRTWGLLRAPPVPARWARTSGRWSFNTLWRNFRAAFWGAYNFRPLSLLSPTNLAENQRLIDALYNAAYASMRA